MSFAFQILADAGEDPAGFGVDDADLIGNRFHTPAVLAEYQEGIFIRVVEVSEKVFADDTYKGHKVPFSLLILEGSRAEYLLW